MGPPMVRLRCRTLFSTHLFHLRERKALLVAYPSTSAALSVGKMGRAMAPENERTHAPPACAFLPLCRNRLACACSIPLQIHSHTSRPMTTTPHCKLWVARNEFLLTPVL